MALEFLKLHLETALPPATPAINPKKAAQRRPTCPPSTSSSPAGRAPKKRPPGEELPRPFKRLKIAHDVIAVHTTTATKEDPTPQSKAAARKVPGGEHLTPLSVQSNKEPTTAYSATITTGQITRDPSDPKGSDANAPCNNKSIWLCLMLLFKVARAKPEPNNETPDVNPLTDDLGTTNDEQERPQPGPAEGLQMPPLPWARPTKGLADDNTPQQSRGRPGQGPADIKVSICHRPPEEKATDNPNKLIDVPTAVGADDHQPTGEVQGGEHSTPPPVHIDTTPQLTKAAQPTTHPPHQKPRNDPPNKSREEPEPDEEPPDQKGCNDNLQRSHRYKQEPQLSRYSQAINTVPTFLPLPEIITYAYAAQKLRDYVSPEDKASTTQPTWLLG